MSGSLAFTVSLHRASLTLDVAWLFAAFLILLVAAAGFLATRRFLLERGGGTVECALRRGTSPWRLGVASYQSDELRWFNAFGISQRPEETFGRRDLMVVSRRPPDTAEIATLGPGRVVVECELSGGRGGDTVQLALAESALTGLLAWLEAAPPGPPGSHLGRVQLMLPVRLMLPFPARLP
ncbi:MAG: DUF2550 domain-containing protein [Streptosporangiaceae bacterium]|nr:DUF2550 domain-containing protein [Streptosporangiaceae bacterium]